MWRSLIGLLKAPTGDAAYSKAEKAPPEPTETRRPATGRLSNLFSTNASSCWRCCARERVCLTGEIDRCARFVSKCSIDSVDLFFQRKPHVSCVFVFRFLESWTILCWTVPFSQRARIQCADQECELDHAAAKHSLWRPEKRCGAWYVYIPVSSSSGPVYARLRIIVVAHFSLRVE